MHWFSDKDAWMLYRLGAFGEVVGWSLLISAIVYRKFGFVGSDIVVSICGTLHGVLFLLYFAFTVSTARSMAWGPWRVIGALVAGNLPYIALIYERIIAYHRKKYPVYVDPPRDYDS